MGVVLTAIAAVGALGAAPAGTLAGKVVGVSDGESLTLLTPARTELKIRLDGIDAPERDQPWGARSKEALSAQVYGRTVAVRSAGRDRYGRTLAVVSTGGAEVNAAMVRGGAAWAYRQYLKDDRLIRLEGEARAARRGLWALPAAQTTPPWDWRAAQRGQPRRPERVSDVLQCGTKRSCKEMRACEEARFHLRQCGVGSLDADGDGTPCEALCLDGGRRTA
jgi:endonuclease YncB( thermonuclease family)